MFHVNKLNNSSDMETNLVVSESLDNSGNLKGNWMAYLGEDLVNSGSIDYAEFVFMPNLSAVHNTGMLNTGLLFVHEDVSGCFSENQYNKKITIEHHDEDWDSEVCDEYLNSYIQSHPEDFS